MPPQPGKSEMSQLASRGRRRVLFDLPLHRSKIKFPSHGGFICVWRFPTLQGISGCAPQTSGHSRQCPAPLGHLSNVWRSPPTQTSFLASHIMPHIIAPTEPGPFGLLSAQSFLYIQLLGVNALWFLDTAKEKWSASARTGSAKLEAQH